MSDTIRSALKSLTSGSPLTSVQLETCFDDLLSGDVPPEQIGAFLMGLAVRGETSEELQAGAKTMRKHARKIDLSGDVLDTCGTGGLNWTSLNTSTASAIVLASCGVTVAKHGNRSVPPKTGSADVLEALGVGIELTEDQFRQSIKTAGIGFLFARAHHSAMRHVAPVRASLGIRTIFNLLGPLSNPASATHQILGVYSPEWLEPMAQTLLSLGITKAWVVHGEKVSDRAIDELSIEGPTQVVEVSDNNLRHFVVNPQEAGLEPAPLSALTGGDPQHNADALIAALKGQETPFLSAILLNASAGLVVTGKVTNLKAGVDMAREAITTGKAIKTLENLRIATQA